MTVTHKRIRPDQFFPVGKVKDAHGIRGDIYVLVFSKEMAWLDQLECLRLVRGEGEEPQAELEIQSLRPHKDGFIVRPKGFQNRNQAEELKGLLLEIPGEFITTEDSDEDFFLNEILEFEVRLKDKGLLGKIVGFLDNGAQDLIVVKSEEGRFEIPLVDDFIIELNRAEEFILMDLPEGLLEV